MQNRLIAYFLFFISFSAVDAQTNGNSPYSRFGIGDLVDDNFLHLRAMGSIGTSYVDGYHINIVNPASYASLRATAFDIGMSAKRGTLTSGDLSNTSWSGNLQYLSLAFPLGNDLNEILDQKRRPYKLGMAFTLMPNSNVGYNITSMENIPEIGDVTRTFAGDGGSYKFLWGNAIKYKEYSLGVNLGYLFGNIEYNQAITFDDIPSAYQDLLTSRYNLKGFLFDIGAMYTKVLNQKQLNDKTTREPKMLSIGARLKSATNFSTNLTDAQFAIQSVPQGPQIIDTISFNQKVPGNGKLPVELGFGASYYNGQKYMVGFDFSTTNWSSYTNDADPTVVKNPLKNTMSVSLGGFYRPNYKSYNRYFKRVYYRYGLNYKTDPRTIGGTQINSISASVGMGMPFIYQRKVSHANLGLSFGKNGSGSSIEETFMTINFGFTFNDDEWFVKRKYN